MDTRVLAAAAFRIRDAASTATTPKSARWTDQRIEAAIRPLVIAVGRWPTKSEFHRAGLSRALSAVYDHGGSARWQHHFGVEPRRLPGPVPDRTRWTQERIEHELRTLISRCGRWPSEKEFHEFGPVGLYSAAVRHGGARKWRKRLTSDSSDPVAG